MNSNSASNISKLNLLPLCSPHKLKKFITKCMVDGYFGIYILDCRSPKEYNEFHIKGAVVLEVSSLLLKRLKMGRISTSSVVSCLSSWPEVSNENKIIILYDSGYDSGSSQASIVGNKLTSEGYRVFYLEGGFSSFQTNYPEFCMSAVTSDHSLFYGDISPHDLCGFRGLRLNNIGGNLQQPVRNLENNHLSLLSGASPTEVLPRLFLGDAENASDKEMLDKLGIKCILNVTNNLPNTFQGNSDIQYLQIPISDHFSQELSEYLPKAIEFINNGRQAGYGVLVHCLAGISRSVSVTVAYIMSEECLSLNDAFDRVRAVKRNISPNFSFLHQLLEYEQHLMDSGIVPQSDSDDTSPRVREVPDFSVSENLQPCSFQIPTKRKSISKRGL